MEPIINYLQQFIRVAQWGTLSCSKPQPATNNGVRDGRSNWLVGRTPPPSCAVLPERHVFSINRCSLSSTWIDLATSACEAATQGSIFKANYNHIILFLTQRHIKCYLCILWCSKLKVGDQSKGLISLMALRPLGNYMHQNSLIY